MAQRSSVSTALAQDLNSVSRHPHSGSQSCLSYSISWYLISSSGLYRNQACMWYTCMHGIKTSMHKKEINVLKLLGLHLFCAQVFMCVEIRGQRAEVGFLLPPSKSLGFNLHHQTRQQVPLSNEPPFWPLSDIIINEKLDLHSPPIRMCIQTYALLYVILMISAFKGTTNKNKFYKYLSLFHQQGNIHKCSLKSFDH